MPTDTLHRLLLDNLTTAVILLNGELRLEYMNPAAEMLLAVSGQRSHGQFISELFTESPEALNSLRQAVEQAHPFTKREATLTSITGVSITVDYAVTPILNRNETLLLLEVHPRDRLMRITREEAQLSKQETTKLLVRGLAHEIKNPLGGIRGAAQLLSRELPEESLKDYTNVIIEEADRLRNLVDRMLGSNKLPNLAPTNIHEVLERVSSLVEAESQGSITLVRDYDPSIPDLLLDREQMIQAVLNMVRNAMQAIAGQNDLRLGRITLRSRTLRQFTIGHTRHRLVCKVEIIDNGPGIPAELQETIFYPMVSGRPDGTGLGLAIAQNIISQHQGLIECEATPAIPCSVCSCPGTRSALTMSRSETVWIVDDDRSIRWVLEKALQQEGMTTVSFDSADSVIGRLGRQQPDVIISDIRMPGASGLDLLAQIRELHPRLPVIIMTAHSDLDSAVASYQGGAFEYLPKPFDVDEAVSLVKRANQHAQEQQGLELPANQARTPEIIGEAPAMQEVFRAIGRLSHSNITVLINGESGTGKELVAHALHRHSPRAASPFIALNMAAIPKDLMESELFGHEKGAFTGAAAQRRGRFEQADGGTLFLDEIGDMPADTQTRLLRVLADGEFYRVGGHTPVKVDVRIIAATHQNLESLVRDGKFREDLFHRLNVIRIHIPRLADRREDIPALARHFLSRAAQELAVEPKLLKAETEEYLKNLGWPGNVRQLENTCRWITVMASGREVHIDDLPPELLTQPQDSAPAANWEQALRQWADQALGRGQSNLLDSAVPAFERIMIETALKHTAGRRRDAAVLLGWGRNTLTRKIRSWG